MLVVSIQSCDQDASVKNARPSFNCLVLSLHFGPLLRLALFCALVFLAACADGFGPMTDIVEVLIIAASSMQAEGHTGQADLQPGSGANHRPRAPGALYARCLPPAVLLRVSTHPYWSSTHQAGTPISSILPALMYTAVHTDPF